MCMRCVNALSMPGTISNKSLHLLIETIHHWMSNNTSNLWLVKKRFVLFFSPLYIDTKQDRTGCCDSGVVKQKPGLWGGIKKFGIYRLTRGVKEQVLHCWGKGLKAQKCSFDIFGSNGPNGYWQILCFKLILKLTGFE